MNAIRRRTIQALTKQGIKHLLVLNPTTTLFDKEQLYVLDPTVAQLAWLNEFFAKSRAYMVKVSAYGSAMVHVTRNSIDIQISQTPVGPVVAA